MDYHKYYVVNETQFTVLFLIARLQITSLMQSCQNVRDVGTDSLLTLYTQGEQACSYQDF